MSTLLHPKIQEAVEEIESVKQKVESWNRVAYIAQYTLEDLGLTDRATITVGWGSGHLNGVLVQIDNVKSPREATPIMRKLAEQGFRLVPPGTWSPNPSDYPEIQRRTYDYGDLKLSLFFNEDGEGASCKFAKVGKQTADVYKFICPEDEGGEG